LDRSEVVIKVIPLEDELAELSFQREVSSLQAAHSPYLVRQLSCYTEGRNAYIVLEPVRGGTLHGYLQARGSVDEATALRWIGQLTEALEHLWRINVIHRDLKPENVMLTEASNSADVKLIDMGIARYIERLTGTTLTPIGTERYLAPEVNTGEHSKFQVDIWGLGALLYELTHGLLSNDRDFGQISREFEAYFPKEPSLIDVLLAGMLKFDPKQRILPAELRFLLEFELEGLSGPMKYCKDSLSEAQISIRIGNSPNTVQDWEGILRPDRCLTAAGLNLMVYKEIGVSLASVIATGPLYYAMASDVIGQLLGIVSRLHAENYVLGPVDPETVLLFDQSDSLLVQVLASPIICISEIDKSREYANLAGICLYMLTGDTAALLPNTYIPAFSASSAVLSAECAHFLSLLSTGKCDFSHPFLSERSIDAAHFPNNTDLGRAVALANCLILKNSLKPAYLVLSLVHCALSTAAYRELEPCLDQIGEEVEKMARWLQVWTGQVESPIKVCTELLEYCETAYCRPFPSPWQTWEAREVAKVLCRGRKWLGEAQTLFPRTQRLYSSLAH